MEVVKPIPPEEDQSMNVQSPPAPVCDNEVVAALIVNEKDELLMIRRATHPAGHAPVCGHRDDHGDWVAAACAETFEEVGLQVETLVPFMLSWMPNKCRRAPGPMGVGHNWTLFKATVTGEVVLNGDEASEYGWYTTDHLQALAARTIAYCHGNIGEEEWLADPGLEPAWVVLLSMPNWVDGWTLKVHPADRAAALHVAAGNAPGSPVEQALLTHIAFH